MSGCADVCLSMDFDDSNEFYLETLPKARKPHKCCECQRVIHPGEKYQRAAGKSDNGMWDSKTCAECTEIRKTFVCGSWVFGRLWEEIEQVMFPIWDEAGPIDCLAKIESLTARNALRARYAIYLEIRGKRRTKTC